MEVERIDLGWLSKDGHRKPNDYPNGCRRTFSEANGEQICKKRAKMTDCESQQSKQIQSVSLRRERDY